MNERKWSNKEIDELFAVIMDLENIDECYKFFEDLCTIKELQSMAQRLHVAKSLKENKTYTEIENETKASTATISRVNKCVLYGSGGYEAVLEKLKK